MNGGPAPDALDEIKRLLNLEFKGKEGWHRDEGGNPEWVTIEFGEPLNEIETFEEYMERKREDLQ